MNVPVSTAYNQWTQFEEFPEFMDGVESIRQTDPTHLHWIVKHDGTTHEFDTEITEQHPDERIAWKTTDGDEHSGVVTFHRISDKSSRIMVQMDWKPKGALEKIGAALGADDRRVKHDLENFKEMIENRTTASDGWRHDVSAS